MFMPSFRFKPVALLNERIDVEKKHKYVNNAIENSKSNNERLKWLIDEIERLDIEEVERFAYTLKSRDLYLLADYLPGNNYNIKLRKVFEILKIRFRKGYLKIFLNGFQKYYDNKAFNRYFKFFLENYDADKILGYTIGTSEILAGWLDKENIIKEVVGTFLEHGYGFIDFINRFRFNNMSKLVIECKKGIYIYCDKELYLLTEPEFLLETIKSFNSEEQAYFANNYLSKVPLSAFQEMILIYINSNFGKPDNPYKKKFWEHINDFAKDQYTKWLIGKTLKDFFGESERFRFWSHFLNNIQNYYLVESRGQLFLDFGPIVVIEFRNSGNAAYIYKRSDFDKYFRRYTNESNSVSNAILKNQDIAFERIIHQGDWEYRAITIIGGAIENANR